ncbi:MAG: hypothetical protein AAFN74_03730 [Myxococcota bacterium]
MERLINAAIEALSHNPKAAVSAAFHTALARLEPAELLEPLLAIARFSIYLEARGFGDAFRSLNALIDHQRIRLPSVRAEIAERSNGAWQHFLSADDFGVPVIGAPSV